MDMPFSFLNQKISTLHSAALILGAAGFLSRLLGLLRDRLLAGTFGASRELDIYYAAFQIPDFIYTVLLLGAGTMAILPLFVEANEKGFHDAERFINELITLFTTAAFVCITIGIAIAPMLIERLFPGFDPFSQAETVFLTRMMLISPFLLGLSGIFTSVVQAHHKFLAYAVSGILYNVGIIAGILFLVPHLGVLGVACGVILGALFHLLSQFFSYSSVGFTVSFVKNFFSERIKKLLWISGPRVLALSLQQITFSLLLGFASTLSPGSITVFQFSNNLGFLPAGIFGLSYATALFPRLAEYAVKHEPIGFYESMFLGVRTIAFWVIPLASLFVVLRAHIVRAALGAGIFDWSDTRLTAAAFGILSIAFIGTSFISLFLRGFYALKETRTPLFINSVGFLVSIGAAFFFTRLLQLDGSFAGALYQLLRIKDIHGGEVLGIILGYSFGILVNALFLLIYLFRLAKRYFHAEHSGEMHMKQNLYIPLLIITGAAVAAGYGAYGALLFLSRFYVLDTFLSVFFEGLWAGLFGIAVYGIVLYLLKSEDLRLLGESLRKRFFKLGILPDYWNGEKTRIE